MKWSVVTVSKLESKDILEWACWYKLIGAEKIYLYDSLDDDTNVVLMKLIREGFVELIPWDIYPAQYPAYEDARIKFIDTALAFVDADELIIPLENSVSNILDEVITDNVSGLAIGWDLFGCNGHVSRPKEGLMIENYTKRQDYSTNFECFTKCIMIPNLMSEGILDPHWFQSKEGFHIAREDGSILNWGEHHHRLPWDFPKNKIKINHYISKSKEDYIERRSRRGPDGLKRELNEFEIYSENCNSVYDRTAHKWLENLKELMGFYK
jgi:hypothetical protein